ncbi:MAG: AAA family ATPase [Thiovulaceae bacterium]|nr:AAA family ATPase [Sulfurimonadaceae bacterium]
MKVKALKETLQALIAEKLPAFVWGSPGIGKSAIIKEIAEDLSIDFIDLRFSLLAPTDLHGIPFLQEDVTSWALPDFLPRDDTKAGILFLDELNEASVSVQAAAYQLILDRKIAGYELPSNWAIIAAGHHENAQMIEARLSPLLANRFVHFELDLSVDDWRTWAYANHIDHMIISFLSAYPDLLSTFDTNTKSHSFATPRSWEFVDTILKSKIETSKILESIGGAVGHENAASFLTYRETLEELPDYHAIFEGRSSLYPQEATALYKLASILVTQALRNPEKIVLNNMLRYTLKMKPEFAILIIGDLQAQGVRFDRLEAWRDWTTTFNQL